MLGLSAAERETAVIECFERWFGARAAAPQKLLAVSWTEDPWTRGCNCGYMAPGAWTALGPWLRRPHKLVHWAGAETATRWYGSTDGAAASGERAADEVLAALQTTAAA